MARCRQHRALTTIQYRDRSVTYDQARKRSANRLGLAVTPAASVDTALLLDELQRTYKQNGARPIDVDFRNLVKWVRLGDQLTHQIHPYPGKLLPNIAHFFSRASSLSRNNGAILDPFCGSGSVALEASIAGRKTYIADANPLALLISKVKTTPYDPDHLATTAKHIVRRASRLKAAASIAIVNEHIWYPPNQKKALEILARAVSEVGDTSVRDFFRVCLSVTARRLSLADPSISVPVRLRQKPTFSESVNTRIKARLAWALNASALEEFLCCSESNIARVRAANMANPKRLAAMIVGNDARQLTAPASDRRLTSSSIPLIITSPPYGSAQKYVRASSLSLNWLQLASPDGLASLEGCSIGREHIPLHKRTNGCELPLPDAYEELVNRIEDRNRHRALITRHYLSDMRAALQEMTRITRPNGHIVIVIGNNQVCGLPLRNDDYVTHTLQALGLSLDLHLIDHIKSRGLMTKRNKTASVISRESVLVFSKPSE